MTLINQIKSDNLTARKNRDSATSSVLTTLFSEAANVGKNDGNRQTTDAETVAIVKKFVDRLNETIAALKKQNPTDDRIAVAEQELVVISRYLPTQLTEQQLIAAIDTIITGLLSRDPKQMGVVMKNLKENYGGCYDGALASKLIKQALQN